MTENEEILLGFWLRGEKLDDIKHINSEDFSDPSLVNDIKSGKDMLTIGSERRCLGELSRITLYNSETLYKLAFAKFMETQIRRRISEKASLDEIYDEISYLKGISLDDIKEAEDPAVALLNELNERSKREKIKWDKLPTLNNYTLGIKRKELTAIAARPSVGKSAFALQIAYGAWKQGAKVLYFPLEMSTEQSFARVLVMNKYATAKEVQSGEFRDNFKLQIGIDHIDEMYKSKRFKVYEGEGLIEHIEAVIKREKPFLVVIDQLTQMRAKVSFKDIRAKFSYMTSNLKRIALQENVAILLLCQINRDADNTKPTMANLKESGSIEEDSDNVILLHRLFADDIKHPENYDWSKERPMFLNLAKQRDGETGEFVMVFSPSTFEFTERAETI